MNKAVNIYAPRPAVARAGKDDPKSGQRYFSLEFFVCFVSFGMLLYASHAGTWAAAAFLAPWILIIMKKPFAIQRVFLANWPLLLMAALTLASTCWSDEPLWTLRSSLELTATMGVGILAASLVKPKIFIAALLSAFALIAVLCLADIDQVRAIEDSPMSGIFGSKNAFSAVMALLMLISISVLLDKGQAIFFRAIAVAGIMVTPVLLHFGQSLDAILSVCLAVAVFMSARFLKRFDRRIRLLAGAAVFILAVSLTFILAMSDFNIASLLRALGKDPTLTGRTNLWKHAIDYISDRPLGGVGYQAFWRLWNPRAQELWYESQVPPGAGFNFHNEYLAITVELGFIGLALLLGYFFVIGKRVVNGILGTMTVEKDFAFLLFAFFVIRTPVEAGIFGPFSIITILFCTVWIYLRPASPDKKKHVPLPGNRLPARKEFIANG